MHLGEGGITVSKLSIELEMPTTSLPSSPKCSHQQNARPPPVMGPANTSELLDITSSH